MIKPSINLQELRRRIYRKAKADKTWRFWGLYVHVFKLETLRAAYQEAQANDGAPGLDGVSFEDIEFQGGEEFLNNIQRELLTRTYKPSKNRRVEIPKEADIVPVLDPKMKVQGNRIGQLEMMASPNSRSAAPLLA